MNILIKKLFKELNKKKLTVSIVESCTGGLLSSKFTLLPGSSKIYKYGLITYSNSSKIKLLKIPKKTLKKYGAVSKQICLLMVKNLNKFAKTDISISTTGIAGPEGGSKTKPVGLVYIGIKYKKKFLYKKLLIQKKNRDYIRKITTNTVLQQIIKIIN
jgi:PncC family amidohydrolase